jgi:hypothetical protein
MTTEREIDYEALAQNALRGVVRTVLGRVAKTGLPGDHHFYIAFRTAARGVLLSKRLMQKYPEEMTVVLQHRFWNLIVTDDRFEVKLTFDGIEERLSIPFAAIKVFFDPSVPYGLQFEDDEAAGSPDRQPRERAAAVSIGRGGEVGGERRTDKRPRALRRAADRTPERAGAGGERQEPPAAPSAPAKRAEAVPAANDAKVVKLDTFRKK